MPALNLPNFIDTWVADSGVGATSDQSSSSTFKVGTSTGGDNATGLIKIPLTELPNPQNAHISDAVLNLYAQFGSDTGNAVSIHPALVAWNTSANGTTYDGINNWSSPEPWEQTTEAICLMCNKVHPQIGWSSMLLNWFKTPLQTVSLTFLDDCRFNRGGQTIFSSTDGLASERPWLNLTWSSGNASSPEVAGTNTNPTIDEIIWDTSTHALLPGATPTFAWSHPNASNVDDWRIFIWDDYNDERAGWTMYDSRDSSEGWDITNLTWTSPDDLSTGESYEWFIQPITDDILGARGQDTIFHIPAETGNSINSTDAEITLQEGQIVDALDYPAIFMDTYIDSGSTNQAFESSQHLIMGRSNYSSSLNYRSVSLLMVNWSSMPIPASHEFTSATLTLHKLSGGENGQETVKILYAKCSMNGIKALLGMALQVATQVTQNRSIVEVAIPHSKLQA